ncbi:MAG: S8 family serine peptidase [Candidatus Rokuibacteriota bacterium]
MNARRLCVAMVVSLVIVVSVSAEASAARRAVPDALVQQAFSTGSARVIVRLNAPFSPEAETISAAHAAVQRQDIAAVRRALKAHLAASRHALVREYDALPFLALEAGPDALALLEALTGLVVSVEEDRIHSVQLAQSVSAVQAPQVWAAGFDGTGTIVAVLDTGVQKTHPFLSGKVIAEACFSSNTTLNGYTITSLCPGRAASSTAPGSGVNCSDAVRGCDHGTHVAGIVAGGTTGASGAGVAPGAAIMAIQVFSRFPRAYPACGGVACALSFSSDQIAALNHVFNQRHAFAGKTIASVNMSLGGGGFTAACESNSLVTPIDRLRTAGIATVIASGNNGFTNATSAPACAPGAVSVGSTGDGSSGATLDSVSWFSNSASFLSLLAPGHWIRSSVPGGFANFAGTSTATPHVAGAFALLRQANADASVDTLLQALQDTGMSVRDGRVLDGVTKSRINIAAALALVAVPDVSVTAAKTVAAAAAGEIVDVVNTVKNHGPVSVGSFKVDFHLSTDAAFTKGVDVRLGARTVPSLAAGAKHGRTSHVTIPAGTAPGRYWILVRADAAGALTESSEANNVRATAAIRIGPDLTVTVASTGDAGAAGGTIAVSHTVQNGPEAVGSFKVAFYLSTNKTFNAGSDVRLRARTVTSLAAGAVSTKTNTLTIPGGTAPGTYRILVRVDDGSAVAEANESNNVRATAPITIGP